MKIAYRREMKSNYLIIDPEEPNYKGFELPMLEKNKIEGLLKFHLKNLDGQSTCYYEITSKQSLSRILEYRNLGEEELKKLIGGIASTLSRLEAYLLKEDQILLDPEYIYVEPERFKVFLCLIPGRKGNFSQEMTGLLRYLLGKVNHQDKECVVKAYGLYHESLKENYGINDLIEIIENKSNDREKEAFEKKNRNEENTRGFHADIPPRIVTREDEKYESRNPENNDTVKAGISPVKALFLMAVTMSGSAAILWLLFGISAIVRFWYGPLIVGAVVMVSLILSGGKKSQGKEYKPYKDEQSFKDERSFKEERSFKDERSFKEERSYKEERSLKEKIKREDKSNLKEERYDWQMAFVEEANEPAHQLEEEKEEEILQTVLLTDTTADRNARYLRAVGSEVPDITISYVPYLIGKQEGLVDYVLEGETISRIHARIDRAGEEYQLCDLNSTNGTSINGRILETNETVTLKKGDEVFIANFAFIFT